MTIQQGLGAKLRSRQHGAVAVIVALCLVVLIGMLGMVVDLGRLYVTKTELQNAADAAALSGAQQLDGTAAKICCDPVDDPNPVTAVGMAIKTASLNSFYSNTGKAAVAITADDVEFADTKDGDWVNVDEAKADPANKLFIRVNTASGNLSTWFIHVIPGVAKTTSTIGVAVAGHFPPGALTPMFVPVIRRNSNQRGSISTPATYPGCNGYIYDDAKNGPFKSTCPVAGVNVDPTDYRDVDFSGDWGFIKANQCKQYTGTSTNVVDCATIGAGIEKGSYYIITPKSSVKWDANATQWINAAAWTGNFGFMLKDNTTNAQKSLWEAMCVGGSTSSYSVPGCGLVHTGSLSGPVITDNLNTRFDVQTNQTSLSHDLCPSDTNIYTESWPLNGAGLYAGYLAGDPTKMTSPTNYPPGKAGRRLIRVYVIDNAWLPGVDLTSPNDDSCYNDSLGGAAHQAHIVGCAEFFMWKPADNQGKLYAEFVRSLNDSECKNAPASNTAIRLYH